MTAGAGDRSGWESIRKCLIHTSLRHMQVTICDRVKCIFVVDCLRELDFAIDLTTGIFSKKVVSAVPVIPESKVDIKNPVWTVCVYGFASTNEEAVKDFPGR